MDFLHFKHILIVSTVMLYWQVYTHDENCATVE